MRAIQYFSREYLERCAGMKPEQILAFLDEFRRLHSRGEKPESKLISIKIPVPLLTAFREKAGRAGTPYQTQIKILMEKYLR
jgi:predicted DNA binding CopG/RHH family protein